MSIYWTHHLFGLGAPCPYRDGVAHHHHRWQLRASSSRHIVVVVQKKKKQNGGHYKEAERARFVYSIE
eukprot:scaffold1073_cov98-Cylindrotheca_fusiformis.AAC.4